MNDFKIGDLVLIKGDIEHDDPVAAEAINKHGIINSFIYPEQVSLTLLNGNKIIVTTKNIELIKSIEELNKID